MSTAQQSPLGKAVQYQAEYDASLLFPIPRQGKRDEIGVTGALPFMGVDIWNGYELSWLNPRGKPQVAIALFEFPADSTNIVESKSFKLYLNSFNQTRLANADAAATLLRDDLSQAAGAPVRVQLIEPDGFAGQRLMELDGYCIDNLDIEVDQYQPAPQLLHCDQADAPVNEALTSNLLKSNCLVTGQPDWASVQIRYVGQPINRESLLRYLISFRQHNEFHEQCVERIFMDLMRACKPMKLAVYARYTRRGGLDINPYRSNFSGPPPANLRGARQ
ncbi:NADPH-dependent 7-cyano-7-deazaguanine reductase QueF [Chitinolyticbacter meiyuanensis]|uniref:NADPH-dependent 7-cyano-7-deazaguanine reductase QueF n=1 Tax=Chitinolyticbacter meiyuanensis TaxID=682798 RepID=UPI0011E5C20B|nr:NADPH-dependent 7-cyano-7-deazaguanine reductase QueF [Chitinolyticbacter meiyuanensis]